MLGTNDAKTYQWDQVEFLKDYIEMATSLLNMGSAPTLQVMVPPPLYEDNVYNMSQTVINAVLPEIIPSDVVTLLQLSWGNERVPDEISIFKSLGGAELQKYEALCDFQSCDSCHPNDAGYNAIALTVFKALAGGPPLPSEKSATHVNTFRGRHKGHGHVRCPH
mmetsp:Transcript_15985/g.32712  ORF Transcript_15985/g.32712 Transcript_15985/m.32712 type:complete len:164 (+) Transcript_15985:319-810(+)